ncbi:MAG: hypothetical protein BGP03_07070 [Pseudonocardia sp. 73-21]|nr:MAG: hypothetical protein BGP03_07070 [Pseudonocardia sp. 73-21]
MAAADGDQAHHGRGEGRRHELGPVAQLGDEHHRGADGERQAAGQRRGRQCVDRDACGLLPFAGVTFPEGVAVTRVRT